MLFGGTIFWWAPHPPMTDLPQHAAQVRLLHDMVLGRSPWAPMLRINLLTPYLIGYGLALPLSFVMSGAAALKVLMTIAYFCFVTMCVRLGRLWQCDRRLDWLYLPTFFGFACGFGLFTFLVASPFGLLFLWQSQRYATRYTLGRAAFLMAVGAVLLASHGLMFLFAATVGALTVAVQTPPRSWPRRFIPFYVLLALLVLYFVAVKRMESGMGTQPLDATEWFINRERLYHVIAFPLTEMTPHLALPLLSVVLFLLPILRGCRVDSGRHAPNAVFVVVIGMLLFAPSHGFRTDLLNERFALFVFPAYAWIFKQYSARQQAESAVHRLAAVGLGSTVALVLGWQALQFWRFGQETAHLDAAIQRLEPNQRALALMFDPGAETIRHNFAFRHYASWYQAEQGGFVEFNFAWFLPQVVRFRIDHLSPIPPPGPDLTEFFQWQRVDADHATYFFVHKKGPVSPHLFDGAPCPPAVEWHEGEWTIYRRVPACT